MAKKIEFQSADIRNIALVGHGFSGKTSLGEAMLFNSGATTRLGSTTAGTGTLDFEPEEEKRGGSIATSLAWIEHDGKKINILDTPGDGNFIFDAFTAMRGADAAVVVVSCPDGVEVQTERVYNEAEALGLPRVFVINKMDRDRADFRAALEDIKESFGITPVPLQVPIGSEASFEGVVSLLQMKALHYKTDGSGEYTKGDIPDDLQGDVDEAWEFLVETVASTDDELLEKYLETFELSQDEVRTAFHNALKRGEIFPVIYTAAASNVGVHALMDLVTWAVPNPLERGSVTAVDADGEEHDLEVKADGPFVAQVIKTFMDEFSGKQSIFRIFSGTVPGDGQVTNQNNNEPERMGALHALRGHHRDTVDLGVTGDILAVAKLKSTSTNQTLATDTDLLMPRRSTRSR
jgi:elongation factor G